MNLCVNLPRCILFYNVYITQKLAKLISHNERILVK